MGAAKHTVELAIAKAGGIRPLCRILDWNPGSLMRVLGGERISPYRAGQVADYLELSPAEQENEILEALSLMSRTEVEAEYWRARQDQVRLRERARQLALHAWLASGDSDPMLYEKLEKETLAALVLDARKARITLKRRSA